MLAKSRHTTPAPVPAVFSPPPPLYPLISTSHPRSTSHSNYQFFRISRYNQLPRSLAQRLPITSSTLVPLPIPQVNPPSSYPPMLSFTFHHRKRKKRKERKERKGKERKFWMLSINACCNIFVQTNNKMIILILSFY
jgi:hypothetical protein